MKVHQVSDVTLEGFKILTSVDAEPQSPSSMAQEFIFLFIESPKAEVPPTHTYPTAASGDSAAPGDRPGSLKLHSERRAQVTAPRQKGGWGVGREASPECPIGLGD